MQTRLRVPQLSGVNLRPLLDHITGNIPAVKPKSEGRGDHRQRSGPANAKAFRVKLAKIEVEGTAEVAESKRTS